MTIELNIEALSARELEKLRPALDFTARAHGGKPHMIQPQLRRIMTWGDTSGEGRRYVFPDQESVDAFKADLARAASQQDIPLRFPAPEQA